MSRDETAATDTDAADQGNDEDVEDVPCVTPFDFVNVSLGFLHIAY